MEESYSSKSNPAMMLGVIMVLVLALGVGIFLFSDRDGSEEGNNDSENDKVVLQLKWVEQAQFAGYLVADAKGFYEEENIDIEIQPGGVGINPVDVLIAEDADIAVAWTGNTLPAVTKGEEIVNIGQGFQRTGMRMMALKDSEIESSSDLEGKKIGVWAGGNELEPYAFIEKQGLDKDRDVELVSQNFDMNQLLNGEIDLASAMIYNEYWLPMNEGYEESDFTTFDLQDEGAGMLQDGLFVKKDYLDENKDLLVRFMKATMKGWDYAITNQEESVDLLGIDFGDSVVTERDHQVRSMGEVAKLMIADEGSSEGLFFISPEKMAQTVQIAETYIDEVEGIDVDAIYNTEIWQEAVKDIEFSDYSGV